MPPEFSAWLTATKALVGSPGFLWLSVAAFGVALVLRQRGNIVFGVKYAKAVAVSLWERVPTPKAPSLSPTLLLAGVVLLSLVANRGCTLPDINWPSLPSIPVIVPSEPATAATYVYEKDDTAISAEVAAGLNRLNREKKVIATVFEDDTRDGSGEVPDQYKVPLASAQGAGLPALVVTSGDKVLKVVKDPKTEAEVMEAVQ
jgi:hypothetical protein